MEERSPYPASENRFMQSLNPHTVEEIDRILATTYAGEDPPYEQLANVFPIMRYHSTIVGVRHHVERIHVGWDGTIDCVGHIQVRMAVGNPPVELRKLEKELRRELLDGYLPVVETTLDHDDIGYTQTVLGYSPGFSPSEPLVALMRVGVENRRTETSSVHLSFAFKRSLTVAEGRQENRTEPEHLLTYANGLFYDAQGSLIARLDAPEGTDIRWNDGNVLQTVVEIPSGETRFFELRTARNPLPAEEESVLTTPDFDTAMDATRVAWQNFLGRGMSLSVPDSLVNNAFRAWSIYGALLSGQTEHGLEPHDAADFYEHIYGHAAACYLHTLAFRGDFEEAKRIASVFIAYQRDNGMLSGEMDVPHQNGSMIMELCRLYRMSNDREWFAGIAPNIRAACQWIIRERTTTMQAGDDGSRPLTYGMLPEHRYCVDKVARFTQAQDYLTDTLNCVGLREAVNAFRRAGFTDDARRFSAAADEYRRDLISSMRKAVFAECRPPFLPLVPGQEEPYGYLPESREGAYYSILSPRMLESGIFEKGDRLSLWVRRFLEDRGGLILGVSAFLEAHGSIDAHFVYGYAMENLRDDLCSRVLLTYYTLLLYGMSRDTYSPPEGYSIQDGYGKYAMPSRIVEWDSMPQPHLHSLSQMERLTRMLLVHEDGNELWLARAIPRPWLRHGESIRVDRAQTIFGEISYLIDSFSNEGRIEARLSSSFHEPPQAVNLRLRHPESRPIHTVLVNDKLWTHFTDDTVTIDPAESPYRPGGELQITVRY